MDAGWERRKEYESTWAPEPVISGYGCTTELLILCCHTILACVYGVFTPHLLATSGNVYFGNWHFEISPMGNCFSVVTPKHDSSMLLGVSLLKHLLSQFFLSYLRSIQVCLQWFGFISFWIPLVKSDHRKCDAVSFQE